ncbi:MAG: AAA family ATPase [Anaerolineae bacterium]|nr:AAA family ATPase [Anaerolineae bacterium]
MSPAHMPLPFASWLFPLAIVDPDVGGLIVTGVVVFVASSLGFVLASFVLLPLVSRVGNGTHFRRSGGVPVEPLITTKVRLPHPRANLVARPRLFDHLDRAFKYRLMLLSAPAGSGKTTLVNQWATTSKQRIAYLSLDEGDNTPARFLTYLIAALQTIRGDLGGQALNLVRTAPLPAPDSILAILINNMAGLSDDFVLILDNYQVIDTPGIHDAVAFLLGRAPAHMHILIVSRAEPSLPLARLRASGDMAELRAADLRFTADEAAALLNGVMGLNLAAEQIAALESHTEGWIAGLQLAALALRDRKDVSSFVKAFSGSHPHIARYLTEEVFDQQPERVQTFLLQTSILERLSAPLCDALTGQANGKTMLEWLERANLFLLPLDEERQWYRYHRLFADYLSDRLRVQEPHQVARLHRAAAYWFEQQALVTEAVPHPLAIDDSIEPDPPRPCAALPEPLSERELEVLRLITAGLSNQEIAEKLTVTLNTVKAHVRSVYGKLDAHSRVQAVSRARELELL